MGGSNDQLWASETIIVGDDDVTGLVVGLQRGISVKGKIDYAGAAPQPGRRHGVAIMPVEVPLVYSRMSSVNATTLQDGSFEISNLLPGRYAVFATGAVQGWRLGSVTLRGVDITDSALTIEPKDISDLVITMTDAKPALIEGSILLKPGEEFEDFQVCVFPADRRYWAEPFVAMRRFSVARLSPSSSFMHFGMPSGEYFVAVREQQAIGGTVPSADWMEAPALEALARTAERVRVGDGETKVILVRR